MTKFLKQLITKEYALDVVSIKQVTGGWAAFAFVVSTKSGKKYFLKAYDKKRSSTFKNIRYIRQISNVTKLLATKCDLAQNIPVPIKTVDEAYFYDSGDYVVCLLEYIDGKTVAGDTLNEKQATTLAKIVDKLHSSTQKIEFHADFPREVFDADSAQSVLDYISQEEDEENSEVLNHLYKYEDRILENINICLTIAQRYKEKPPIFVLCHTDIHTWNIMVSDDNLWLIDFEGLRLAPKEHDLWMLEEYRHALEAEYSDYSMDIALVEYYSRLRILDDINDEIEALCDTNMSDEYYKEHKANLIDELEKL